MEARRKGRSSEPRVTMVEITVAKDSPGENITPKMVNIRLI